MRVVLLLAFVALLSIDASAEWRDFGAGIGQYKIVKRYKAHFLGEKAMVQGVVHRDSIGNVLEGAKVTDDLGKYEVITTDAEGNFKQLVDPGLYQVTMSWAEELKQEQTSDEGKAFVTIGDVLDDIKIELELEASEVVEIEVVMRQMPMFVFKPVIYLYPQETTSVDIELNFIGHLDFTYPEYSNGWSVTANPDGSLELDGKSYDYLFWDGTMDNVPLTNSELQEGAVVSKEETVSFLEESLAAMGLSPRERQDFITFWAPALMKESFNYIHFELGEEYNDIATIDVSPAPDHVQRVFMLFAPVSAPFPVTPQKFESVERDGFTLIEWGGGQFQLQEKAL